jgi:hypothetical protein
MASPPDTTLYAVQITTPDGCIVHDSLLVLVQYDPPEPVSNDTSVCVGASAQLLVSGGDSYVWQPAPGITDLLVPDPVVSHLHCHHLQRLRLRRGQCVRRSDRGDRGCLAGHDHLPW